MSLSPLHASVAHPELLWIVVPSVVSFVAGTVLGSYADRIRDRVDPQRTDASG